MTTMPSARAAFIDRDTHPGVRRTVGALFTALMLTLCLLAANLGLAMLQSRSSTRVDEAAGAVLTSARLTDSEGRELQQALESNRRLIALSRGSAVASIASLVALMFWLRRSWRIVPSPFEDTGNSRQRTQDEKVHARAAELTQLSRHLIRVAEEDKADLARELHDTFGSNLTAINMDLNWIARRLPAERPELTERLHRALGMLRATVRSTQDSIDRLRPSQLDNLGLAVALRSHCEELAESSGLACRVDAAEDFDALDRTQSITLYRVAQEALANVAKHARAANVEVELRREDDGVRLRFWDDGVGLPDEISSPSHGMVCMRERIEALGGTLTVASVRDEGTRVDAVVPANVP